MKAHEHIAMAPTQKDIGKQLEQLSIRDLNLLVAIFDTKSVSRAAEFAGISQSTASYSLDKMRWVFQDPLFIRKNRMLSATPICVRLATMAKEYGTQMIRIMDDESQDPRKSKRVFRILTRGGGLTLVDKIVPRVLSVMPYARVEMKCSTIDEIGPEVFQEIDLVLGSYVGDHPDIDVHTSGPYYAHMIFDPRRVIPPTTVEDFLTRRFAISWLRLPSFRLAQGAIDSALKKMGYPPRDIGFTSFDLNQIASVLKETDLIFTGSRAFLPESFNGLVSAPIPFEVKPFSSAIRWSKRHDDDPVFRCFLDAVISAWEDEYRKNHDRPSVPEYSPDLSAGQQTPLSLLR